MGALLRKYGEAATIIFPMIKRGVVDFAVAADWTPASGDTQLSKDEGAFANSTNTPAHEGQGVWSLSLSATEMQAARIAVAIVDSATKAVEDQAILIETYGHASAQHALDLDTAMSGQSVASVSGAVGSVTGNVGGSVDSVVDPVTVGTISANVVTASALATDAITEIASGLLGATVTEGYPAVGGDPTLAQLLSTIMQAVAGGLAISGTNLAVYKRDGVTTALLYLLNDASTPTTRTRTS